MNLEARLAQALLRQKLLPFITRCFWEVTSRNDFALNWHLEAIAWHLEQCRTGDIRRLIITLPPRHLKSLSASVAFPAWLLGHDPSRRIIVASYSQALAIRHAEDFRTIMRASWYLALFPNTRIAAGRDTQSEITTTRHGGRFATSVGGTLTGRGGNVLILDDVQKPEDTHSENRRQTAIDWYRSTLASRLDNKITDTIIVIQQRLHEDDLPGYLLEQGGWTHLNLPAIADAPASIAIGPGKMHQRAIGDLLHPAREPWEVLDQIKAELGSYNFAAQYQQSPAPEGGGIVRWDWFGSYDRTPERTRSDQIVQSWDTALKVGDHCDYSVCLTALIQGGRIFILDLFRERLDYPSLSRAVQRQAQNIQADVILIEDTGHGAALIQDMRDKSQRWPIAIRPEGDKVTRLSVSTPIIEAGQVFLPKEAPWLADFKHELMAFPRGKHDDQVDAFSQVLIWFRRPRADPEIRFI